MEEVKVLLRRESNRRSDETVRAGERARRGGGVDSVVWAGGVWGGKTGPTDPGTVLVVEWTRSRFDIVPARQRAGWGSGH